MSSDLHFTGFIRDVSYTAKLTEPLTVCEFEGFDINAAKPYGLIQNAHTQIAYSWWKTPKRTRTYPFERIYNTYNSSKKITIIPVIKDEGRDGDLDRIQFSTVSWMSLLNIYIVLGYYETAKKNSSPKQRDRDKLNRQKFNNAFVKAQIAEVMSYHQSALHWNRSLFEKRFAETYKTALNAYAKIGSATGVEIHDQSASLKYLARVEAEYEQFKNISLRGSLNASRRESLTTHRFELLEDGAKATFEIENYLGGVYHLTADEALFDNGRYVIQESKHTSKGSLPAVADIKDGLFKLILFTNLDALHYLGNRVESSSRLKLTGSKLTGNLHLPANDLMIEDFVGLNSAVLSKRQREIVKLLQAEATANRNLSVLIKGVA